MTFSQYIALEIAEIRRHKWIESERAGRDLGNAAVLDWIQKYSPAFRRYVTEVLGETIENETSSC